MLVDGLTLTLVSSRTTRSRHRTGGEHTSLYAAHNATNNARGLVRYEYGWDKRDVTHERLLTNNATLFPTALDESPSAFLDVNQADYGPEPRDYTGNDDCGLCVYGD
jgi:hypothetical protein